MTSQRALVLTPNVLGIQRANGKVVLAGRLISGALEHIKYWDGRVVMIVEPAPESELEADRDRLLGGDNVEVDPRDLPFELHVLPFRSPRILEIYREATLGLGGIHHRETHLSWVAKKARLPFIYTTEYTLRTRIQIAEAEAPTRFKAFKEAVWATNEERKNMWAIALADGVQCNGVPTYNAYRHINRAPLLFFDGRITEDKLIEADRLEARLARLKTASVIRLGFSGRLNKMKGGDELVEVAKELRKLGAPFTLDIWGGGVLADDMKREIAAHGLGDQVRMRGYVQFETLVRTMQDELDVFLCCHPQGDPAGAYMEAYANGLPILGYDNEALVGLLEHKRCGVATPMRDRAALARAVVELWGQRDRLAAWSREGVEFARQHTFDKSFRRRNDHFEQVVARARRG